jgi:UDP:flavonoid glycosyltransferase YjiC (YdhE family)
MRVLITTSSGLGHVLPMVPLAHALRGRGHDVLWATGPDAQPWVRGAGLRALTAGLNRSDARHELQQRHPELRTMSGEEIPDLVFPKMFGGICAPAMFADLLPLAKDWSPRLVVHDAAELAGPVVAAALGVPSVTKSFGALTPRHRVAAASDEVAPLWRSVGLPPPPYAGSYEQLYLDVYPPGMQPPLPAYVGRSQPMRPVAYDLPEEANSSGGSGRQADGIPLAHGFEDRPLVYLTMGTVFSDPLALRRIVNRLASLEIRLLVTVGPVGNPDDMGDQPPNVRIERYVAQTLVLPLCQAVISHGGSGTMLQTLSLGLPQLCLPHAADQFMNAEAIAASGAGLALVPTEADSDSIADAALRLLDEPSFRECAMRQGQEIALMPGPQDVVAVLEGLT